MHSSGVTNRPFSLHLYGAQPRVSGGLTFERNVRFQGVAFAKILIFFARKIMEDVTNFS
jgi:hypothetical protein